jgi:small-conductance mechanosensitive channel
MAKRALSFGATAAARICRMDCCGPAANDGAFISRCEMGVLAGMTQRLRCRPRLLVHTAILAVIGAVVLSDGGVPSARAAEPAAAAAEAAPPPEQARALIELLGDPQLRDWLRAQLAEPSAAAAAPEADVMEFAEGRLEAIRRELRAMAAALPRLPPALAGAWSMLEDDLSQTGVLGALALVGAFVGLGFGAQWLYWMLTGAALRHIVSLPMDTVPARIAATLKRFGWGLGWLIAFALGSVGAFLLFDWPPVLRSVVLAYLLAFVGLRLALVLGRFLLAPGAEKFRIVPMDTAAARFWYIWSGVLIGFFFFAWATMQILLVLGVEFQIRRVIVLAFGFVLFGIGIAMIWRRPRPAAEEEAGSPARRGRTPEILLTVAAVVLWVLWLVDAMPLFWLGLVALALPAALLVLGRAINHLLRPPEAAPTEPSVPSLLAVCLERGLRAALLIGAVYFLAWAWDIDAARMAAGETMPERLVRGLLQAAVILLLADFAWHLLRTWIDRKLFEKHGPIVPGTDEARRQSRLRTLLPILRNIALVVLVVMAALMALSALGVEIGPLIAGAGVVGVAIGFGAQTLVKDIIAGMFYLLDDAFRVGEYIISGEYKGTVESFSLRSVKLRHHRGYLFTVPFGELGAVQNMSRDWVIDKLMIGITYDSDLDKVKKIIKQVSKEIMADPDLAANVIEPLKMQGVETFDDFSIRIRLKMMTKPGEQFTIRRRAYALIKRAFDANGIHFAFPTVTVAGGEERITPAVAQQALELTGKPAAE